MDIKTEAEIDGEVARELRRATGMKQPEFWRTVGVIQATGSLYETGKSTMPRSVRMLLVLRYVAGVKYDVETPEGIEVLRNIGSALDTSAKLKQAKALLRDITKI